MQASWLTGSAGGRLATCKMIDLLADQLVSMLVLSVDMWLVG